MCIAGCMINPLFERSGIAPTCVKRCFLQSGEFKMRVFGRQVFGHAVMVFSILAISGCAQTDSSNPTVVSDAPLVPVTGSTQGVNTHNSEPMPRGMVMRNNGLAPSTSMSTDPTSVPQTGSEQGANPHNSQPMPRGMEMKPSRTSPLRYSPDNVPRTGSSLGVNTHDSEPMPSGMVMPTAPKQY